MHLNSVPVETIADTGSARCLISSHMLALVKGEHFLNYLEKKSFRPIYDANSKPLRILGALQLDIRIEKFTAQAEFLCYQGTNKTALLGFMTMKDENLLVYPKLGLFCCSRSTNERGDACFAVEEDKNVEVTVEQQQLLLPVAATAYHAIPPGASVNMPAQVLLPTLAPQERKNFAYSTFVFSSESVQKDIPLHKISIYWQYQTLPHDLRITLRFVNHFKTEQCIAPGDIIAHGQELQECADDEIKKGDDQIMKYIHSIFRPDLRPVKEEDLNDQQGVLGKASKMGCGQGTAPEPGFSGIAKSTKRSAATNPLNRGRATTVSVAPEQALRTTSLPPASQPSIITSHTSAPYTFKTDMHELKGPDEAEGSYSLNDVKIESDDPEERAFIHKMYTKYKDAVSQHEYDSGEYVGSKLSFTLKKGTQAYHARAYQIASHLKPQADALINQLISAGIVGKLNTPAHIISQIHFVQKALPDLPPHKARYPGEKDTSRPRKLRAVINHKVLNSSVNLPTRFPQPTIPEVLRKLHSATVASCSDLRAAFYSIRMHPTVFPFLAFEYCNELLYFKAAPMGFILSSFALAAATQYMKLRHGLTQCDFIADDCLIYGDSAADYMAQVEKFFKALQATGFRLHPLKTSWFCRTNLPCLGFILNLPNKSLLAAPQKIKGIMSMTQPRNKRDVKRFVGAVSFLSQFIFGLQQLLRPLHTAAAPKPPFVWSAACNNSWLTIKRSIAALPALRLPSPRYPLELHCDSSPNVTRSLCWLWSQRQGGQRNYLIQFGSKCLSKEHWALSQPELELLGLCAALQSDRHLVTYTNIVVNTDAKGLTFLATYEQSQSKLKRWKLYLESLPITVRFQNNTNSFIRIADMIGRGRQQVVRELKIKKPLAKDNLVFPVYNFDGIQDLPLHHCLALIKSVVELQKLADLDVDYPIMPNSDGAWLPLAGMLHKSTTCHGVVAPLASPRPSGDARQDLNFLPAAQCIRPAPTASPDPPGRIGAGPERAAAALQQPQGGQKKVNAWIQKHWDNDKVVPAPPSLSCASSYALSMVENKHHHLPSLPHKSVYTNPTTRIQKAPLMFHKYEINNLNQEEKEPALRFLLMVNSELAGLPLASIRKEQEADKMCADIISQLKEGRSVAGHALFNGLLLKVQRQPTLKLTLILPQTLGVKYLAYVHESTSLFHLTAKDLVKMSSKYFSMKHMSKMAQQVTDDCQMCSLFNLQRHKAAVRGRRFLVSRPRQMLHCDVCTFFTAKANKSYFVIVDYFSYLTSVYVLQSPETAEQLAAHLLHYIASHNVPAGVCVDNAAVHEGVLSQSLALLNIRKYQISPRVPQPNLCERINQYLLQKLRLLYSAFQINDKHLPSLVSLATHVFNCTPLKSLDNHAPYTLHFGEGPDSIGKVPTVGVSDTSPLPPYIKAIARLQTALWDTINAIRRRREGCYRDSNDLRRRPLFQPGDYVRMRADVNATHRHHKLVPRYKKDLFKCVKVLPKSGNYILLRMTHKNQLRYGFYSKVGIPKRALVWAKESRLKKCRQRVFSRDPVGAKLLALFSEVALKQHPTPKSFMFNPQVGKTFAVDKQLQKLTNFVINKEIKCPQNVPQQIRTRIRDSEFGDVYPPSDDDVDGQLAADPSLFHYRLLPASSFPTFDAIVQKVLPADLAEIHLAAGCKPPGQREDCDDDPGSSDDDGKAAVRGRQLIARPPAPAGGQGAAAGVQHAPTKAAGGHLKTSFARPAPPQTGQRPRNAGPVLANVPHSPSPPISSPSSSASSTGAVDYSWDPTFDFGQPAPPLGHQRPLGRLLGARRKDLVTAPSQPSHKISHLARFSVNDENKSAGGSRLDNDKENEDAGNNEEEEEEEEDEEEEEEDEEEEEEEYYEALADAGSARVEGRDQGVSLPGLRGPQESPDREELLPAEAGTRTPQRAEASESKKSIRTPNFQFSFDQNDSLIQDLRLPSRPMAMHGPQLFGNDGLQSDIHLAPSTRGVGQRKTGASKSTKHLSRPSSPTAHPIPPPHPNRTRPVSERLSKKSNQ